jgi:hypothetical protein
LLKNYLDAAVLDPIQLISDILLGKVNPARMAYSLDTIKFQPLRSLAQVAITAKSQTEISGDSEQFKAAIKSLIVSHGSSSPSKQFTELANSIQRSDSPDILEVIGRIFSTLTEEQAATVSRMASLEEAIRSIGRSADPDCDMSDVITLCDSVRRQLANLSETRIAD